MDNIGTQNWLKLVFLAMLWGGAFMAVSVAVKDAGPLFVTAVRLSFGAMALLIAVLVRGKGFPAMRGPGARRIWGFIFAMAFFTNALPFSLLGWAQQIVPSGFAGVCMAVSPLITLALVYALIPSEKITLRRVSGLVLGSIGVIVLIGPAALSFSEGLGWIGVLARAACLGAAACYAIGSILTRLVPETDRLGLATAVLLVAAMMAIPNALINETLPQHLSFPAIAALVYLGIFPTGLAQVLLVQVIRDAGPVFMSLVNYQVPLWAVAFGSIFLAEPLPSSLFLALALILSGMALSQFDDLKRLFFTKHRNKTSAP